MKLSDQVITRQQAQRLKELGIAQESMFAWTDSRQTPWYTGTEGWQAISKLAIEWQAAFTVAELGNVLPECLPNSAGIFCSLHQWHRQKNGEDGEDWWYLGYGFAEPNVFIHEVRGVTEAQARATMLIYLLEINLVKVEDVNNRLKQ